MRLTRLQLWVYALSGRAAARALLTPLVVLALAVAVQLYMYR